jgi:hypothetical protein
MASSTALTPMEEHRPGQIKTNRLRKPSSQTNLSSPKFETEDSSPVDTWEAVKVDLAKKKSQFIFYSERELRLY